MSKRMKRVKHAAPVAKITDADLPLYNDPCDPNAPSPPPAACSLDYIYADIWSEVPHCCSDFPNGARGYIVLGIGDKWVRLFSPVTLDCHKMPVDAYDALKSLQGVRFDPEAMLARVRAHREQAVRYGWFDGGKAADEAERAILASITCLS